MSTHPSTTTPSTMSPPLPIPPITLIVATTPTLGIGFRGTLPWPPLKSDLRFFARVTKRPPPPRHPPNSPPSYGTGQRKILNAVIMGRKTWLSLPPAVRPLKGRINVILTRGGVSEEELGFPPLGSPERELCLRCGGIEEAVRALRARFLPTPAPPPPPSSSAHEGEDEEWEEGHESIELGRVFVIGGAEVYKAVLEMEAVERVLWTRLGKEWKCDTWFPPGVIPGGEREQEKEGWVRRSTEEMERWVGEKGVGGWKREGEVEFEVMMWERGRRRGEEKSALHE